MDKSLHLLLGTLLFGIIIASYLHISFAIKQGDRILLQRSLLNSLISDVMMVLLIPIMFISATQLVRAKHFSFSTPWIEAAYLLLGICFVVSIIIGLIKFFNYRSLLKNNFTKFRYRTFYHLLTIFLFLCFIAIIHDAIFKQTFL